MNDKEQEVCPIGEIGYYYPAEVFVGGNGLLYCVYSYQDEIEGKTSQRIRDVVCASSLLII